MKLQKPKGTADLLPAETAKWQYIEEIARGVFNDYNFKEIRTPMFESYELFSRATGETSDIVTKEMYDFEDKGDVILRFVQKELPQLFGLILRINSMPLK